MSWAREQLATAGAAVLGCLEEKLQRALREDGRRCLEALLNDPSVRVPGDQTQPGESCHAARVNTVDSLFGPLALRRDYYCRRDGGGGRAPLDQSLGVVEGCTPGLARLMARAGALEPFEDASLSLAVYCGIELEGRRIQRLVQRLGPEFGQWNQRQPAPTGLAPGTLFYVEADGTGIPARPAELVGREGKAEDGQAKTREIKVGVVFTQEPLKPAAGAEPGKIVAPVATVPSGPERAPRTPGSTRYVTTTGNAAELGEKLRTLAIGQAMGLASLVVFLGDGAAWVWELARVYFPGAKLILDFYHAAEHLALLCELLFGKDTPQAQAQREAWIPLLRDREEGVAEVIHQAQAALPRGGKRRTLARKALAYFENNRGKMRYWEYQAQGLFIGSGVVEAACKTVVGQRLKRSGMFWGLPGAHNILDIRCVLENGQFDQFWNQRALAQAAASLRARPFLRLSGPPPSTSTWLSQGWAEAERMGRLPAATCDETAVHNAMEPGLPGALGVGHDQARSIHHRVSPETTNPHPELEERLRFETLIADLSSKFVDLPAGELDREIMAAERRICEVLGLDILALWQKSDEAPDFFTATHYYSVQEGPQPPGRVKVEDLPWLMQQVLAGHIVAISSLEDLPPEAARDRELCRQLGVKSNLTIPLSVGGQRPFGALGLNTTLARRDWTDELVKRLQLLAQVFANALARKRADQVLRESEARLNLAADAAAAGLWSLDLSTRAFWLTQKTRELFHFSAEEDVRFERFLGLVLPEDRPLVQQTVEAMVQTRNAGSVEYRIRIPDQSVRWISSRGSVKCDPSGKPHSLMGISTDITDRKRAEEALRVSEARLAAGTELAGLGYYEIDYAKRTSFIDDRFREICGVPPDRRQGLDPVQFWMERVHPSDLQLLLDERQKLHDGRIDRISAEYRYLHPDLGEKWIHHLARIAERSAAGGAVRIYGVLRDITPQKQAEAELLRQRTELAHIARVSTMGELAASLAHELNQPLGAILANAETAEFLLEQDTLALEEMRPVVTAIRKDGERAGEVIRRMRGLFGKHELKLELLDLNSLVHDVRQLVSRDLALRGISLSVALAPGLPEISGDRTHLQQVVLNLIVNAMDALAGQPREKRHIRVSTCPTTDCQVEMAVTDSGPGIEPDTLPRVFQPFYTTKPDGMGMGLSIARTIIDAHCGRIWAENITTGGAAFRVALPASGKGQVARPGPVGLPPRSTRSATP